MKAGLLRRLASAPGAVEPASESEAAAGTGQPAVAAACRRRRRIRTCALPLLARDAWSKAEAARARRSAARARPERRVSDADQRDSRDRARVPTVSGFPAAERVADSLLTIPTHHWLSEQDTAVPIVRTRAVTVPRAPDIAEIVAFWCSVALVVYAYAGLSRARCWRWRVVRNRPVRARAPNTPRVSFIITAHNEEARIREKIENTLAQDYPAPRARDHRRVGLLDATRTDDIVRAYAPRVRLVRAPRAARQGSRAAARARVGVRRDPDLLRRRHRARARRRLDTSSQTSPTRRSAASAASIASSTPTDSVSGEGAYVRYEMFLRALETRVNSLVGLSGSFFAARREVCRAWAADRQSDFSTLLNAVELGLRGVLDPAERRLLPEHRRRPARVRSARSGRSCAASPCSPPTCGC